MSSVVASPRSRFASDSRADIAIVLVGLAAFASTFVPMLDSELLYYCGCEEWVTLSMIYGGAPAMLIAALAVMRIVTAHRGGVARRSLEALSTIGVGLVLAIVLFLDFEGAGYVANAISHAALLALLVTRFVLALVRQR
jgi:hypothetical protein